MTVQLTPSQIADRWEEIRSAIKNKRLSANEEYLAGILKALSLGRMQAWLSFHEDKPKAIIITSIESDPAGPRFLLIFLLMSFKGNFLNPTSPTYQEALAAIKTFAHENDCTRLSAFVGDEILVKVLNKIGFNQLQYYVGMEI